jgi:hypothetical protein
MRKIFLFIAFISMYFLGQAQYAPTSSKTRFVNGIGLSTKDTASLSNAGDTLAMIVGKDSLVYFKYKGYWKPIAYNSSLNSYVKYSDTSSMLSPYQRSFSAMKYSDTATMLSSYYNKTATNSLLNTKLNTSDTATMLSGYKTYYPRNAISGGTGISYNSSTGVITNTSSGTVTSVATNNGSGITGGTITTSGTIAADTSVLATRLRVQKGIDSINANVSLKLNISDTANMLSGYKTYYPRNAISGGTGITYNAGTGVITNSSPSSGGTVTSVATDATMTGGTITTSGTLKVDTTVMATRLRVQKGIDSVSANINLRVKYSDTATMLSSYYNKTATDSKLALKLNISDTATMLSPYARTLALGGYIPYTGATGAIDLNAKTVVNISHLGINTTTVPTILLRAIGDNNSTSRIAMRGYSSDANSSSIRVTKFRGTAASPQAPLSGDGLGKFELAGYGTTSSDGYPQASFEGIATENWGATARGAKVQVKVTPNTTTTQAIALTINQDKSAVFENSITGTSLIKTGGTSSQFLKADGSVDANAYLNISDTATMLSGYKTYYPRNAISGGTGITYNASTGVITNSSPSTGGTVTSVATDATMTGGTITTTGTLKVDTTIMATRLRVQKGIDSLGAVKLNISDTATMLSGYKTYYPRAALSAGTGISYNASTGVITNSSPSTGGTVTSVATNTGSGITGGTITTSGTIAADTSVLSTKANVTASLLSKVSSVSATSPIASSGGLTPTISISQSSGSTNGYLSSTDWNTFNNKGSGSVTSIATDATMTGGTITTSGTLKVDTSVMATRLRVQKGIDSLGAAKQTALNGTGFVKASGTTISYDNSTYYLASNPSGFITGNQTITLSGDVSGSGATAITTTIGSLKVTNGMLAGTINYSKMDATTVPTWNQNTTGTAANITATSNSTITTLSALSLPYSQLTGTPSLSGYVTSVTGTSPIVSSGGTTPAISIPAATSSVNGYLTSTDWNTFNGKQGTITLTTTGSSGAATLVGATLNIPNYGSALSGYVPYTGATTTLNLGLQLLRFNSGFNIYNDGATLAFTDNGGINGFKSNFTTGAFNQLGTGAFTLTGALSGTSASFSSNLTAYGTLLIGQTGVTNGIINSNDGMYFNIDADASGSTPEFAFGKGRSGTSGGTTFLTITNSGNLGLGVTPSAWYSTMKAITVQGSNGNGSSWYSGGSQDLVLFANGYYDAAATPTRNGTGGTAQYRMTNAQHSWWIDATTTGAISLTQAMTLDASGNLGIGTTSPNTILHISKSDNGNTYPSAAAINVSNFDGGAFGRTTGINFSIGSGVSSELLAGVYGVYTGYTSSVAGALTFITNNGSSSFAERMRITSGGNVLIGTTTDAGYLLDVNGTGRFSGALSGTSASFSSSVTANASSFITNSTTYNTGLLNVLTLAQNVNGNGTNQIGLTFRHIDYGNGVSWYPASIVANKYYDGTNFSGELWFQVKAASSSQSTLPVTALTIASTGAATFSSTLGINGVSDNIKSGTYTPTVTKEVGSMTSISAASATYTRVGNVVTVVATFTGTPDSGTNQYNALSMTLPINTNSANGNGNIVAQTIGGIPSACGIVYGYTTSTVYFDINTNYPAPNTQFVVSFQYQVTL